jgi:hypothetical protein
MKPFVINRDSWHYALNKRVFNDDGWSEHRMRVEWEPSHNNACAYWRATMVRMLAVTLITSAVIAAVAACVYVVYTYPLSAVKVLGVAAAFIAAVIAVVVILEALGAAKRKAQASLFVQRYRAHKQAICPNIEYR